MKLPKITSSDALHRFVTKTFGLNFPRRAICPGHDAPWDYVWRSFQGDDDLVVWACRGGGKSMAAALTTTLRAIFQSPIEQVILGGSQDQSDRVAAHVRGLLAAVPDLVDGDSRRRRIALVNGSVIHVLAQSETSVRGIHADKIRCDEVELFDREVWRALWFCTTGRTAARGSLEALSTAHVRGGIMEELIERARKNCRLQISDRRLNGQEAAPSNLQSAIYNSQSLITWCLWDVIERCPPARRCDECPLADDCRGQARAAEGFFRIDDAIAIKLRSSRRAWDAEMLCRGAARHEYLVFGEFDPARHVRPVEYCRDWPLYRAIDFGYRDPLVCLWVQVTPAGGVHVLHEYVQAQRALVHHVAAIRRIDELVTGVPHPAAARLVAATCVDPAGRHHEAASGASCTDILAAAGIPCTWQASGIEDGLELIRTVLAPATEARLPGANDASGGHCGSRNADCGFHAAGPAALSTTSLPSNPQSEIRNPQFVVSPSCVRLIEAFNAYHYPPPEVGSAVPAKDGPDHLIDALRYFFVNRMRPRIEVKTRGY